ncbi:MAG TPA: hypothetical protein PK954_23765, partial [Anaerolineales bacterium]|nr:hypothetical protein [Anaerolineales bacterium]
VRAARPQRTARRALAPLVRAFGSRKYALGLDSLVELGMSLLTDSLDFSAALNSRFTLGVVRKRAKRRWFE